MASGWTDRDIVKRRRRRWEGGRTHQFCNWRILCSRGRHILWRSRATGFLCSPPGIRLQSVDPPTYPPPPSDFWLIQKFSLCSNSTTCVPCDYRYRGLSKGYGKTFLEISWKKGDVEPVVYYSNLRISQSLTPISNESGLIPVTFRSCISL